MRIPAEYLCCTKLFRVLGAQETTLPYHFAEVLRCLHRISCDEHSKPSILGPNEKKDILVPAVRNLFLKMRSEDQIGLTMTELYLPNREFILHLSKTLIVSDNNKLEKRANYFKDESLFAGLEKLNLQLEFSACILKLLPNEMKPKFLSEMLKEKLLKSLECPPGDKIQMLSQFVKTPKFIEGLLRLVFDEKIKQTSKFGMDTKACLLDEQEQNRISKQIGNTQFKHVSGLETALFFEGQQLEESTEKKKAFVKSVKIGDTKSWIMYCIDNGCHLQDWLNNIQLAFVKLLEKITNRGLHINQVYVHILLHSITDPDLISDKLDNEEIVQLHYANVSEDIYPDPGTYVPPSLHYLLDNSFSNLKVNDYVAVLLYEEEENNTGQFIDANYMYAKVIKCIDNSQNNCDIPEFEQVYSLDVGETEPNEVPAFKIFKFQRRRSSEISRYQKREKVSIPRTARKWLRQAECDRDAAGALFPNARVIPAFNWICYQCHQSAEKALKALWFNEDANNAFNSHNLSSIAIGLPQTLSNLAEDMVRIVGHHTRMRYPDQMSGDEIPSTIYSQDDAEKCLRIASAIIFFVSQKIRKTGLSKNDEHML
ncbi:unnamed protein product [Mytilus edulis]|uniref:HEPN domain-containing protein n=1 Tax=Mytilus edulis TaxID=6550 RepID=A0A8S3U7S8_MYTED|nr:unnamed protein product [Mytilus edulis]